MEFKLHSDYTMMGDQPEAVNRLAAGIAEGRKYQTLMGVTGVRQDLHDGESDPAGAEADAGDFP